jgi:hypothetical protein
MKKIYYEGWTAEDFINELQLPFKYKQNSDNPLKTRAEVAKWTAYEQPYYKKQIPEVINYFYKKI